MNLTDAARKLGMPIPHARDWLANHDVPVHGKRVDAEAFARARTTVAPEHAPLPPPPRREDCLTIQQVRRLMGGVPAQTARDRLTRAGIDPVVYGGGRGRPALWDAKAVARIAGDVPKLGRKAKPDNDPEKLRAKAARLLVRAQEFEAEARRLLRLASEPPHSLDCVEG